MLRIGFFVWEYPPRFVGGLGTYAEYMTRELVELGHDVSVFTLNPGDLKTREILRGVEVHRPLVTDASNIFPIFVTDDIKRWGTNIRFFNDIFIYNVLSATKFVNGLIKSEGYKFDIVCAHDWLSSIAALIIRNETKIPVVFHVHSTEWGRSGGTGSQVVSHFEEAAAQSSDAIITVSHTMRDDLTRHGWPQPKIGVVWNGVDPDEYSLENVKPEEVKLLREKYGISDDSNMILFLGRLVWVKRVTNLIQAMPLVLKDFPKTKLVILGKGEEQGDIPEIAERLGIENNVIYNFDFVPEDQRILHYAASDVCVFPSVYEPFGIVSLEAMALSKPVVVGARGVVGFREQVLNSGPDQNGVHVNGDDPVDIAWGLREVIRDKKLARAWGENGRKRVLKYFNWKEAAKQTLDVYQALPKKKT